MREKFAFNLSHIDQNTVFRYLLTATRILIGWHFLYEGISKLLAPNWTSLAYLLESHWLFSGFFHWIASNPTILKLVDFLNIWGLIFIGIGLFLVFNHHI